MTGGSQQVSSFDQYYNNNYIRLTTLYTHSNSNNRAVPNYTLFKVSISSDRKSVLKYIN